MTAREPHLPLRRLLLGHHAAHGRARVLRASLRAAAAVAVALVVAVLAGVAHVGGEPWAWIRATLVAAALVAAIARGVSGVRAASLGFDGFLERLERRFPDVRSWLRNALEFEQRPPAHASRELADAVAVETAQ